VTDTIRTGRQLVELWPSNQIGQITAQDGRDLIVSAFGVVASRAPTVLDDSVNSAGTGAYCDAGSHWTDQTAPLHWQCVSGAPGNAVWVPCGGGAQGPAGQSVTYQGAWSTSQTYQLYDIVFQGGSTYISLKVNNTNNPPSTSPIWWGILAVGGMVGPPGPPGPPGPGAAGPIRVPQGGTVTGLLGAPQWYYVDTYYTDFAVPADALTITLAVLPPRCCVHQVFAKTTDAWLGGSGLEAQVGWSPASVAGWLAMEWWPNLPADNWFQTLIPPSGINAQSCPSYSAGESVTLTLTSGGTLDQLTGGAAWIALLLSALP
jgi:hypothetical protein